MFNYRTVFHLWLLVTGVFLLFSSCNNSQNKDHSLHLPLLESPITTRYSLGAESQARAIQGMLRDAAEFYEETLGVNVEITAAVVNASHWSEITNVPYGLPGVTGSPSLVYFPADNNHTLFSVLHSAITGSEVPACLLTPPDSLAQQFVWLIGFHELGHVYASAHGLDRPNRWVYEFQASYLAYAYLREQNPAMASLWQQVSRLLTEKIQPDHTSLKEFEEMYVRVGVENYAWYQGVIQQRVHQVYQEHGLDFINLMKDAEWMQQEETYYLSVLEDLEPGFQDWAEKYGLK